MFRKNVNEINTRNYVMFSTSVKSFYEFVSKAFVFQMDYSDSF